MGADKLYETLGGEDLSAKMRRAVKARWKKYYAAHPEKLAARRAKDRKRNRGPKAAA